MKQNQQSQIQIKTLIYNKRCYCIKDVKTKPRRCCEKAEETYKGQKLKGISFENSNGEWLIKVTPTKIW